MLVYGLLLVCFRHFLIKTNFVVQSSWWIWLLFNLDPQSLVEVIAREEDIFMSFLSLFLHSLNVIKSFKMKALFVKLLLLLLLNHQLEVDSYLHVMSKFVFGLECRFLLLKLIG